MRAQITQKKMILRLEKLIILLIIYSFFFALFHHLKCNTSYKLKQKTKTIHFHIIQHLH